MTTPLARSSRKGRYVFIVADDFGLSRTVNRAVAAACDSGFVTGASIVATGEAFEEAVDLSRKYPGLSVGLHVMLSEGHSVLPPRTIPNLVDPDGRFDKSPLRAGLAYWRLRKRLADQIKAEVRAQFDMVEKAGLSPTHVDCHHHLHMHPLLFDIIAREAAERNVAWIRVPREPLSVLLGVHTRFQDSRALLTWPIFRLLAIRNLRVAYEQGLSTADRVFGLSVTGRMSEKYLLALLPCIKTSVSEIYFHPDFATFSGREEAKAIVSGPVRDRMKTLGIQPVGFRELSRISPREDTFAYARR